MASATKLDMGLEPMSRRGGVMDDDTEDPVIQLCTRIGIIMEDTSITALTVGGLGPAQRSRALRNSEQAAAHSVIERPLGHLDMREFLAISLGAITALRNGVNRCSKAPKHQKQVWPRHSAVYKFLQYCCKPPLHLCGGSSGNRFKRQHDAVGIEARHQ